MPLDEKARLKLEKVFMAFGSQMHALERNAGGEDWIEYRENAWTWAITHVTELVNQLWQEEGSALHSPTPVPVIPTDKLGETDTITVRAFGVQSQGQRKDGTPWTRYQVKDAHGINYYTFHSSYTLGETYEIDWEWRGG
jgi:hypothetical protein